MAKKSNKKSAKLNFINIRNNHVLPFPQTVYSATIDDKATISRLRKYVLNGEIRIALRFVKPSFSEGARSDRIKFTVSANKIKSMVHEKFFRCMFLANIIMVKPIDGRLLCLFDILDAFSVDQSSFTFGEEEDDVVKSLEYVDRLNVSEDGIVLFSERNEQIYSALSEHEKTSIGRLYNRAFDMAFKQGINYYDAAGGSASDGSESDQACSNYTKFLFFCIPFLGLSEDDYERFMEPGNFRDKFELVITLLSLRQQAKTIESDNNKKIDDEIRGYDKTLDSWRRTVKNLAELNADIEANGLDSIGGFLEDGEHDGDDDGDGAPIRGQFPEGMTEEDARNLFEKLTGKDLPPNAVMIQSPALPGLVPGDGRKDASAGVDANSYYGKYLSERMTKNYVERYVNFVNRLEAPDEVKDEICSEIVKVQNNQSRHGADYNTSVDWLETVLKVPFNQLTGEDRDLAQAKRIIDESHYGMKDVKKRIYEFMSLRQISDQKNGAIICLVGPPGVGKTSIAASIAKALGRKYYRFSAGGVRDEAEFLGHRRTYVAALPGKIVQGLSQTKVMNPVFLIDEVDKLNSVSATKSHGDAAGALLSILDPDQNKSFTDLYLNFPLDLSNVIFILTANDTSEMPAPLLDRMEIIEVSSYTSNEKIHITKDYLLGKICDRLKITGKVSFGRIRDDDLLYIIERYTKEAGVRGLKIELEKLIRGQLDEKYSPDISKYRVSFSKDNVRKYLGTEKYDPDDNVSALVPGTSIGLAWTALGGCALKIEVVAIADGKGELKITGQLGDVMKESVSIALSYLRSISSNDEFFTKNDFHLHIPEGATPKDGPSAGITILCAFYSAYSGRLVKKNLAMTGELNLSGEVLPIGGLKEKLYAAKTNGMKDVLIPFRNVKDLQDIDEEIKSGLNIIPVKTAREVLKNTFGTENANAKLFAR